MFFPVSLHVRIATGDGKQGPASGWDNLHVGAVPRHRLDSLNTSNDLLKKKKSECLAGTELIRELCWIRNILIGLNFPPALPITV